MDIYNKLLGLSKEQRKIFEKLVRNLFDKSIEGLQETLKEINILQNRHSWYHSNIYQISNLKSTITDIQEQFDKNIQQILNEIEEQKKNAKEILFNLLDQLASTINAQEMKQHLHELFSKIDSLAKTFSHQVLLISIFSSIGIGTMMAAIITLFAGGSMFGVATLGLGALISAGGSELIFNQKLKELDEKLRDHMEIIKNKKTFTSTSLNKDQAQLFVGKKGVLLQISADCTQLNKPKSVSSLSHYQTEDEVLLNCFSLLTVKKITKINDHLMSYQCDLELW
ncbi:hypothetical protein I4U23_017225 [Adineta vaga]|nr:hypothetical protein I4U23_017225 [Adineta vaga]